MQFAHTLAKKHCSFIQDLSFLLVLRGQSNHWGPAFGTIAGTMGYKVMLDTIGRPSSASHLSSRPFEGTANGPQRAQCLIERQFGSVDVSRGSRNYHVRVLQNICLVVYMQLYVHDDLSTLFIMDGSNLFTAAYTIFYENLTAIIDTVYVYCG